MSSLSQQDLERRDRAPREESGLLCFVMSRVTNGPFSAEIVNESRTGCLVRSFADLPSAAMVSVLVSGFGPGFQRVREGNYIFHAVVVREDRADTSCLYGLKKVSDISDTSLN